MTAAPEPRADARLRFSSGHILKLKEGYHDHAPLELTLHELAQRLAEPFVGSKGSAGYYLAAECAEGKRTADSIIGAPAFVMVDLDDGNWGQGAIAAELDGVAYIAHTTASHLTKTKSNPEALPRWRVLIPIVGVELGSEHFKMLAISCHRTLGWSKQSESFDMCGTRIAQAIFWPTVANDTERAAFECVHTLDRAPMTSAEIAERIEREEDLESHATATKRAEALSKPASGRVETGSVIQVFNLANSLEGLLSTYGYTPPQGQRKQWTSPRSKTGTPSINVLHGSDGTERVYSHRGTDAGTE